MLIESGSFHRADGPEAMKTVGEVEHANGAAARCASGLYGPVRACAAIVGHADLALGDAVAPVLDALIAAGNGRLRGIRHMGAADPDPAVMGVIAVVTHTPAHLFLDKGFRAALPILID